VTAFMSRTDKTAPYYVQLFYYKDWIEEYHDHTSGECDLPPRPRNSKDPGLELWYGGSRHNDETHCYWVASYSNFWRSGMSNCCCGLCRPKWGWWQDGRDPRSQRRAGRRYCREGWVQEY
jgi:hypothetical protein